MNQIKQLLGSLTIGQRIWIAVVAVAAAAGLYGLSRWQHERDYRPLYKALAAEDAGAVVQRLKENGVDYRLAENGATVLVPSARVAELRLDLAGAGLPKNGRIGFELFDKTNFGVTDFAEHINYRRALEGELERSVMSLSEVEQARVHVTFPKDSVFLESRQPAKASVLVRLRQGAQLSPQSVVAVTHLLSSAVEGLAPESVSVLDMRGVLLSRPRHSGGLDGPEPSEAALDYQQKIEKDLAAKINATLEPLLGVDKFRTAVTAECDFTSGEQSEEVFDPTRSVMTTSQRTEDAGGFSGGAGVPGTASSLPRPTSRPGSNATGASRRTENVAYQSSRMVKRTKLPQGSVKHLSVSVLVDHAVRWEGTGTRVSRVLLAPSPEKLKTIRDLVAGVAGITPERGDHLIVESLPFESTLSMEPPMAPSAAPAPVKGDWVDDLRKQPKLLAVLGVAAVVALILVIAGAAWMTKRGQRGRQDSPPALEAAASRGAAQVTAGQPDSSYPRELEGPSTRPMLPAPAGDKTRLLAGQLRDTAMKDPEAAAGVLRAWIAGAEKTETA